MGWAVSIDGVCQGRPARLTVSEEAIELTSAPGGEPRRVPLGEAVEVSIVDRGPTTLFAVAGLFLLALSGLWSLDRSAPASVCLAVAGAGAALLALALRVRIAVLSVASPQGAFAVAFRGAERRKAHEAMEMLRAARPGQTRKPASSVVQFMLGELRALAASEAGLRREYRLIAGQRADAGMEARFLGARRKIALWNLGWSLVLPAGAAAVAAAVGARWGTSQAAIAALVVFAALVFVALKILPRLQPLLARLLG